MNVIVALYWVLMRVITMNLGIVFTLFFRC